jgi:hypothetical protein
MPPSSAPLTRPARCSQNPSPTMSYVAPVELNDSGNIKPGNLRERIRLHGVTIDLPVPA